MAKGRRRWGRIRQLSSGRWQARYPGPDGIDRPAPRTFETKTDAGVWLTVKEAEVRQGDWFDPDAGRIQLQEYGERWIAERPGLSLKTIDLYSWLLRTHITPKLGGFDLVELTPARVRTWRKELLDAGTSAVTVAKAYRLLKAILNTAVDDDLIRRNPCRIKGAGQESSPERKAPTLAQVFALADAIGARWRALVLVAAFCGLRWAELVGLRRRDIDLKAMTITVRVSVVEVNGQMIEKAPKTAAGRRTVPIPEVIALDLRRHLRRWAGKGSDGLMFPAPAGGFLRRSNFIRRQWRPATEKVGLIGLTFHVLRHHAATLAAQCGATIRELMEFLGQTSPRAALIYQHAASGRAQEIARAVSDKAIAAQSKNQRARSGHGPRTRAKSS